MSVFDFDFQNFFISCTALAPAFSRETDGILNTPSDFSLTRWTEVNDIRLLRPLASSLL